MNPDISATGTASSAVAGGFVSAGQPYFRLSLIMCLFLIVSLCISCGPEDQLTAAEETELHYTVSQHTGGYLEGWTSQSGKPGETAAQPVTAIPKPGYVFNGWSDGFRDPVRQDVFGTEDRYLHAHFTMEKTELPIVVIRTDDASDIRSKTRTVGAEIMFCNTGNAAWENNAARAEIRGRGNAAWTFEKKSYRISFEKKQQPLGIGTGKSRVFILVSNHCDQSMLRNSLALDMARNLNPSVFTPDSTFVELYFNGRYDGVYLLAEQIRAEPCRVSLGTPEPGEAPGFLVELDMYAEGFGRFDVGGHPYQVKSDVIRQKDVDRIAAAIQTVHDAIKTGDQKAIAAVLDLESTVNGYLLEEFFKNTDVGWSSFYMYKKAGDNLLYLGPFWDFDLAAGNDYRLDDGGYENIYVGRDWGFVQGNRWYIRLAAQPWFQEMVRKRWKEIQPVLDLVFTELDRLSAASPCAFQRNFERWPIFGQRINGEPEAVMALSSSEEHIAYLKDWLTCRRQWLDRQFQKDGDFRFE